MSTLKQISMWIIASLVLAGTIVLAPTSSAQAAAEPSCGSGGIPWGAVRFYEHANYTGGYRDFYGNDSNWTNNYFNNGVNMNDKVSSMKNCGTGTSYHIVWVFRDINYGGIGLAPCIWPGQGWAVMWEWNDIISSHFWQTDCPR